MKLPERSFTSEFAVPGKRFLAIGINGFSGAGKTFSALRLATGIAKVVGGDVYGIDADSKRMSHYEKYFKFRVVDLPPPHGALDFTAAINHCVAKGAKVIVIDHITAEHTGEGGLLDQMEKYLEEKAGDNYGKRQAYQMLSMARPKAERKVMNRRIMELSDVVFILCFRAADKVKPRKKGEVVPEGEEKIQHIGWQAETTNPLFWDMTVRFLLLPGADGKPQLQPETIAEKMSIKMPEQFKEWFKPGFQLDEAMGERLGRWHLGNDEDKVPTQGQQTAPQPVQAPNPRSQETPGQRLVKCMALLDSATSTADLKAKGATFKDETPENRNQLAAHYEARFKELREAGK